MAEVDDHLNRPEYIRQFEARDGANHWDASFSCEPEFVLHSA
jgi:hypothetical protein